MILSGPVEFSQVLQKVFFTSMNSCGAVIRSTDPNSRCCLAKVNDNCSN